VKLNITNTKQYGLSKFKIISLSILLISLTLTSGCSEKEDAKQSSFKKRPAHIVSIVSASLKPVSITHSRTGTVTTRNIARIYSQEEGQLTSFTWREGDLVKKDEQLIKLDDKLLFAELEKALAETRQAQIDLKRIRNLKKKKAASDDELSRALTAVNITQSEVSILKTRLSYTKIKSPFDAVITERLIEPGDVVKKNQHLLTLIDPTSLYVKAQISELLTPQLSLSNSVIINVDAINGSSFNGKITRIHPTINTESRQVIIEIDFDQLPKIVQPGQFVRLTFTTQPIPRILLPFNTVQHDKSSEFVYLYSEGKAVKTRVKSGIKIEGNIEIVSGIKNGDQIISQGFIGLSDGKPVVLPQTNKQP